MTTSTTRTDPGWNYFELVNSNDTNTIKCKFCGKITSGGIYRGKQHLVGGYRNAKACDRVPPAIKEEIATFMSKKKQDKDAKNMCPNMDDFEFGEGYDDDDVDGLPTLTKKKPMRSVGSSSASSVNPSKKKGPIDLWLNSDPEISIPKNAGRQTKMYEYDDSVVKKELRGRSIRSFARWMYDAGIPFNAVNYRSFQVFIESVGQYGPGMKPPTYHEIRVPLLKQEVETTEDVRKDHKEDWEKYGCSIMSDGWKDRRERTLINFLVNCRKGSMFLKSIDASEYAKTGEKMFELLSSVVEEIGVSNVIQVVTDSAANNVLAGKKLFLFVNHQFETLEFIFES